MRWLLAIFLVAACELSAGGGTTGFLMFNFLRSRGSSSYRAEKWGRQIDEAYSLGDSICSTIVVNENSWKRVKRIRSVFSAADDIPYGGIVYKVVDPSDQSAEYGYMLFAKDTTSGQNVWRLVIYEKTKEDFNTYCLKTPFYDFAVK